METGSYTLFDHTADVGLEVTAPTPESLFETAALALFEQMADTSGIAPSARRVIRVNGADREELLVRWLSELLYLHDVEGMLFSRFRVEDLSSTLFQGWAAGEPYDPGRHQVRTEIKAVTYHQICVRPEGNRWKARIVLDV